ncbi:MAG: hypothetical protein AAGF75_01020 [Cyanobacteria bacterium P01_H01_bin.130]
MSELLITDVFPGATQTADSITIPKADLHPSLGSDPNHTAEPILAALLWQLKDSEIFPDSGFDVVSPQSLSIVPNENQIQSDFDTEQEFLFRELRFRFREPYIADGFDASVYG